MIDLTTILNNAPEGTTLYSPICGELTFVKLLNPKSEFDFAIETKFNNRSIFFDKYGRYCKSDFAECLLFPSSEVRSWEGVTYVPPKPDLERFTPVVTFTSFPNNPREIVILYYEKNSNCYINGRDGEIISAPHAIPVEKFNFETLSWDPNDDYGTQEKVRSNDLLDFLKYFINNDR